MRRRQAKHYRVVGGVRDCADLRGEVARHPVARLEALVRLSGARVVPLDLVVAAAHLQPTSQPVNQPVIGSHQSLSIISKQSLASNH